MNKVIVSITLGLLWFLGGSNIWAQTYKATTQAGEVEWVVVYDWDQYNERHRVGIDMREFPQDKIGRAHV